MFPLSLFRMINLEFPTPGPQNLKDVVKHLSNQRPIPIYQKEGRGGGGCNPNRTSMCLRSLVGFCDIANYDS